MLPENHFRKVQKIMARKNYGKDFENHFYNDFRKRFPNEFILRLKDDVSQYKSAARNPCDFICHLDGTIYMIEAKCHYGNTFPFSALSQFDALNGDWCGLKDVKRVVVIWMIDHDLVLAAPIREIAKMKKDGLVSINVKTYKKYNILELDSIKKRVFLEVDYSKLNELED